MPSGETKPASSVAFERLITASVLSDNLDSFLVRKEEESLRGLIVPHAGYRYSGSTAGIGFFYIRGNTVDGVSNS